MSEWQGERKGRNYPRFQVQGFAERMETELRKNDRKGGWEGCDFVYLLRRLKEETAELELALRKAGVLKPDYYKHDVNSAKTIKAIEEAADVGNFAMMIANNLETPY